MTETSTFFVGILVGVVLGVISILGFTRYFALNESDKEHKRSPMEFKPAKKLNSMTKAESVVTKEAEFPPDWFSSTDNYNLETRAIFSKCWILLTHTSLFSKPGDYHTFTICGYSIFLILGKDFKIRAFHNVCRHRAYTVTRKESGSSTVLGCKYHGWSYDVMGRLVKAPMFDGVPGFRKDDNGLLEVPLRVSEESGTVWVNLDAARVNDGDIGGDKKEKEAVDLFLGLGGNKCRWVDGRTVEGGFNWKSAIVDSNTFNIGIPQRPRPSLLPSWLGKNHSHTSALHLFPCSTVYRIPNTNLWYSIILTPSSSTKTQIRWDLISSSTKSTIEAEKAIASQIEGMVSSQAKALEQSLQLVDDKNKDIQSAILVQLKSHLRVERALGKEVTPAMNKAKTSEKFLQAESLCKELDCLSGKTTRTNAQRHDILAW
ncbi:iron-sulfur cluster-binding protein, putative [Talaromyces stipitatus ATCC 10500]|uniref:Iron-sulfur cluster-binding protein, putative n=1 Tax=Talaromyces stipitatus (strain ATCC 10500 / CBS 375.48 / QM 6759 / NRRL 1006) TaxID=441959 RepID=B8M689_TALSN|nr:iron-sulfur cluster-binding protein, putative [Talaromyces stipitatus ATCC 10500]EED19264.1 iron-sulfur cluster-binding protein, putative [Talaromyces stipitatus ATCC 10500]